MLGSSIEELKIRFQFHNSIMKTIQKKLQLQNGKKLHIRIVINYDLLNGGVVILIMTN